jgi:hypothetical protein
MAIAYPQDLAEFVADRWEAEIVPSSAAFTKIKHDFQLPKPDLLELIISTCYQSSLMAEEHRPVTFRVILGQPDSFPDGDGPPGGLQKLQFTEPRKFSAHELRRLSPAASFHRSLIGISIQDNEPPKIWGFVHSGPRWLRAVHGGRGTAPPMPPGVVINVTGPGHIEVRKGKVTIGQLSDGRIFGRSMNVFASHWLSQLFENVRNEHTVAHLERRSKALKPWADLDVEITHLIGQHMIKRVITAMRTFGHGGTLLIMPQVSGYELLEKNPYVSLKYKFAAGESRARFRSLMLNIMDALAEYGGRNLSSAQETIKVGWSDYEASNDQKLADLDEAVFEVSHLIAGLTSVDGAVLMTKRFELLGFGAEIFCENSEVSHVARALDLEGTETKIESVESVGTRHRSAFRLCNEIKTAIAIVVSQDGSVHFVRCKDGQITYWDHQATISSFDF